MDLTVVGPEAPLALGLADRLRAGKRVVGPSREAARIEWSKAFAKDLMARAGVPTAKYGVFEDVQSALAYLDANPTCLVVKADGLAASKVLSFAAPWRRHVRRYVPFWRSAHSARPARRS